MSKKRGQLLRISSSQFKLIQQTLREAAILQTYEQDTLRRTFNRNMPAIFFLRKQMKYSFAQIAKTLAEVGIKLQEGTVRVYYQEFLRGNIDMYIEHLEKYGDQYLEYVDMMTPEIEQDWL